MFLTFLGTSHGVPSATRYCQSMMLTVGESVYLIDGGAPVGDLLTRRGIPFERVRAVFFTHMHSDHTAGIHPFLDLASWYYKRCDMDVYFADPAFIEPYRALHVELCPERIRFQPVAGAGVVYRDGNITVTAVPTRHIENGKKPTYAYVIDAAEGKRLIITGDLHQEDAADFPQIAKDEPSDVLVAEQAHFDVATIYTHLRECKAKRVLMTHICRGYEVSVAAHREEERRQTLPMPLRVVEDGETYEI